MIKATLANIRGNASRLVAVSLAVVLAVAFLAATLILNASFTSTLTNTLGADYSKTDLVVGGYVDAGTVKTITEADGVSAMAAQPANNNVDLTFGTFTQSVSLLNQPPEELRAQSLESGRWAAGKGEVTIDVASAERYTIALGDELLLSMPGTAEDHSVAVVGLTSGSLAPGSQYNTWLYATAETQAEILGVGTDGGEYSEVQVLLTDDARKNIDQAKEALSTLILAESDPAWGSDTQVYTVDEIVDLMLEGYLGDVAVLTSILIGFASIALLVSAMVVSNTFSVIIAGRVKELAMLRCLGATRAQIKRSVLLEAALLGLIASIVGFAFAYGMMWLALLVAGQTEVGALATLTVPPWIAPVGIVVGVAVTLIAASPSAREATRVAPLAALRPLGEIRVTEKAGTIRFVTGLALFVIGTAAALASVWLASSPSFEGMTPVALVIGVLGCALSATGMIVLTVFTVPLVIRAVNTLTSRVALPAKLAGLNAIRNPRRTGATASALIIGVGLVATVYSGAAISSATMEGALNSNYPVDVAISTFPKTAGGNQDGEPDVSLSGLSESITEALNIAQVEHIEPANGQQLEYSSDTDSADSDGAISSGTFFSTDAERWSLVSEVELPSLADDEVIVAPGTNADTMTVTDHTGAPVTLRAVEADTMFQFLVTPDTFTQLTGKDSAAGELVQSDEIILLVSLSEDLNQADAEVLYTQLTELFPSSQVSYFALERGSFQEIINVLLLIVTGLLAIAIVIAVIGVSNTLSLSVIERTRENGLLRALGLTRQQLRAMLAIESVLIASVATLIGLAIGYLYGWIGSAIIFSSMVQTKASVPWGPFAVILVLSIAAGVIASIAPARRATKPSPVVALSAQ